MDRSAEVPGRLPSNTRRPDVGWTDNDLEPEIDGEGKPSNFTQIDETRHMKFHSGAIRTIACPDAYAAYLVSLHASALYRRRYGWERLQPAA